MPLANLISTAIALDTTRAAREGFGIPMVIGTHTNFAEDAKEYTDRADMLTDGFLATDPEVVAFDAFMGQTPRPSKVVVGKRSVPVAQALDVNIDGTTDGDFTATINGVAHTFAAVSQTATQIKDGLLAAINAGTEPVTATTVDTDSLAVTADNAGEPFTLIVTDSTTPADISTSNPVANNGLFEDLVLVKAANDTWYGWTEDTRSAFNIMEGARWTETEKKFFMAQSDDADILTAAAGNVLALLQAFNYERTALVFHDDDTEWVDAAWFGKMLPKDPGSANWAWQTLTGVPVDTLTQTQVANLITQNGNWFEKMKTAEVFTGIAVGGQYIDIIRGRDWLESNMNTDFVDALASAEKIPMSQEGIEISRTIAEGRLRKSVKQGIVVAGSFEVDALLIDEDPDDPATAFVSDTDKANRNIQVTWRATVQGAITTAATSGTLTI
jgi:hypothetical protein